MVYSDLSFNDDSCAKTHRFICEFSEVTSTVPDFPRPVYYKVLPGPEVRAGKSEDCCGVCL